MGNQDQDKDAVIATLLEETRALRDTVTQLKDQVQYDKDIATTYYASTLASTPIDLHAIPKQGLPAQFVADMIEDVHLNDCNPRLNTSSYVNVVSEEEERKVAALGAQVNIADASVYPSSIELHNKTVNMIAHMWNCPPPKAGEKDYSGSGTVGSTEACLLAGLALKFRWRKWYQARHNLSDTEILAVRPNLVISSAYQAAWEKLFRYFDIEPKLYKPNLVTDKMAANAEEMVALCDEKTIAVVGILGNHYNGIYDPVWDIDREVGKLNKEKGWQIGIHVDAASGGFIAPFQEMSGKPTPGPFDFRLPNVQSMSSSGHKFGESVCGTGWVVFRQRKDLAEHIAVTVTYLGGASDSMTLNFSRPASGPYVQFYKLLRLGTNGYKQKVENQMAVSSYLRHFISNMIHEPSGKKRFQLLDGGDSGCLPVVAARLNPEIGLHYNDINMQHALSESNWYVSGYSLGFDNPENFEFEDLFTDVDHMATMFRIVVKSNLTMSLAQNLTANLVKVLVTLDNMDGGYESLRSKIAGINDKEDDVPIFAAVAGDSLAGDKRLLAKKVLAAFRKNKSQIITQHIC